MYSIPQIQYTSTSAVQNIMQEYSDHRLHEVKAQKLYACGYARVIIHAALVGVC